MVNGWLIRGSGAQRGSWPSGAEKDTRQQKTALNLPFTEKMVADTALWGKTAFRVNDSLKADAAEIARRR